MKKSLLLASLLGVGILSSGAQSITLLKGGDNYGGFMPECISPDGVYLGGSTYSQMMFMSEWQKGDNFLITEAEGSIYDTYGAEIRSVNNDGFGVGFDDNGAVMVDFPNKKYTVFQPLDLEQKIYDAIADGISEDGNVICGVVVDNHYLTQAVVWENGEIVNLDIPGDDVLGFETMGSRASGISRNADVIVGYVIDNFSTYPMVIWTRSEDGSYVCDPVCAEYFGDDKMFLWFEPMALSPDGTKVSMKVMYNIDDTSSELYNRNFPAIYDIPTGTLNVGVPDGEHGIDKDASFFMFNHSISDDGTVVGWVETPFNERLAFIMYPDEMQPMLLSEAFPEIDEVRAFEEAGEHALSGISADGKYICGMGLDVSTGLFIYQGYVIDTGKEAGVHSISGDYNGPQRYFTIDGREVSSPVKGLNIIRQSDGSVKKIMIP